VGRKGEYASLALGGCRMDATDCIVMANVSSSVCTTLALAKRMIKITIGWLSVSAISLRHIIWLPDESHAGLSLPTTVLRVQAYGYANCLRHILASLGTPLGQSR